MRRAKLLASCLLCVGASVVSRDAMPIVMRPDVDGVQGVYDVIENYVCVSTHYEWITRTMNFASEAQTSSN